MTTSLFALLTLLALPFLVNRIGGRYLFLFLLLVIFIQSRSDMLVFSIYGLGISLSWIAFIGMKRLGLGLCQITAIWWTWFAIPIWAPALFSSLASPGANYSQTWIWELWLGRLVQFPDFQPLLSNALYSTWGSSAPLPQGWPIPLLLLLFAASAALYYASRSSPRPSQNSD